MTQDNRTQDTYRINEAIRAPQIRLVDEQGEMIGVMPPREALARAKEVGLDLVEVSPNAVPPVCKILDFGKFKYELQKRKAEARKKQKVIEIKEMKLRPGIDENDYQVKLRNMRRFLAEGNKVKVTLRFRGREVAHQSLGLDVLRRVEKDLLDLGKVEFQPKLEGRQLTMILGPVASKSGSSGAGALGSAGEENNPSPSHSL